MEKKGLRLWTKKVLRFWVGLRLWVVLRLWKKGVYVCGQVLRLWVVYVCGRYNCLISQNVWLTLDCYIIRGGHM